MEVRTVIGRVAAVFPCSGMALAANAPELDPPRRRPGPAGWPSRWRPAGRGGRHRTRDTGAVGGQQTGSSWPCEDRERHVPTVKDGGEGSSAIRPMSWAPIIVCHGLSMSALTPDLPGTDRGRQSANPRITGGLVSVHTHNPACRPRGHLLIPDAFIWARRSDASQPVRRPQVALLPLATVGR